MTSVQFVSDVDTYTGYGRTAVGTMLELNRLGVEVWSTPLRIDRAGLADEILDLLDQGKSPRSAPDFVYYYAYPQALLRTIHTRPLIVNTMYEELTIPEPWHALLDRCDLLIAPSEFCADSFKANGFTQPIRVIPEGISSGAFPYCDRSARAASHEFAGLVIATAHGRKHLPRAVEAWERAFGTDPSAQLTIKVTPQMPDTSAAAMLRSLARDNVRVVRRLLAQQDVVELYRRADVLMALGNEGFGLVPVEGMATGLCVIALDAEGQADLCAAAGDLLVPIPETRDETGRVAPDVEATAAALVAARDDPQGRLERGKRASAWVAANRDISVKARAISELLSGWPQHAAQL